MIDTAKQYIGVPFVWDGDSPSGFDCSGFTYFVTKQHGITIPRTVAEQYQTGVLVSKASLQPGDLVFFKFYPPWPSHVGIYIGDGKFIHASRSDGEQVTISPLDDPDYTERYIGARRYMPAQKEGDK